MNETVTIILRLPPRVLSPNCPVASRGGRFAKASAAKKSRAEARDAAAAAGIESIPWSKASVSAAFYFKTSRRRDQDNYMAMLKSAYDGIVDAGIVDDDDYGTLIRESPSFSIDRDFPRVELTITRIKK